MDKIRIEQLRELCGDMDNIEITQHTLLRFNERKIKLKDVMNAIQNGKIIEQYPSDYPFPSCLLLGFMLNNQRLHTVCGLGNHKLWLITAYIPTIDKWEDDYETRKAVQ